MNEARRFVVDAGVAVKWFAAEPLREQAMSLLSHSVQRLAPDIALGEVANSLLKKSRRGEFPLEEIESAMSALPEHYEILETRSLFSSALHLAITHNRSVFDAIYVVLALREECPLITADEKLVAALRPNYGETVIWLADIQLT